MTAVLAAARPADRPWTTIATWGAGAVVLAVLPLIFDSGLARSMLTEMAIAAVFALSYNMLLGQGGMLSFGHAVLFGLGGYFAIHVLRWIDGGLPLPAPLLPLAGALGGLACGILFGFLSTRRAGTTFAMISLGIGELVFAVAHIFDSVFGGEEGISGNRMSGPRLLGLSLGPQLHVYWLVAAWTFLAVLLMYLFTRTPAGRLANATRDNPERVAFVGYNPTMVRFISYAGAGLFAGMAGGLYAINYEILAAQAVSGERSALVLLMTYIGGVGTFIGPIVGAILVTLLNVMLSDITKAWLLYLGLFFLAIVMFAPFGVSGLILMHGPALRAGLLHRLLPAYLRAVVPALAAAAGAVIAIEMSFRRSIEPELGTAIRVLGLPLGTDAWWSWALAALLVGGGIWLLRRSFPSVASAWHDVQERLQAGGGRLGGRG